MNCIEKDGIQLGETQIQADRQRTDCNKADGQTPAY